MKISIPKILYAVGFWIIVIALFALDIVTKMVAQKSFLITSSLTNVHDYSSNFLPVFTLAGAKNWFDFSLTYVRNTGAAWGFLGNMDERFRPYFFNIITLLAMILIIKFMVQTPKSKMLARFGMIIIFAGACGNFFDRFVFHYVVDWVHVQWNLFSWNYDFPVFNIADSCVSTGVGLLLIDMILSAKKTGSHGQNKGVARP